MNLFYLLKVIICYKVIRLNIVIAKSTNALLLYRKLQEGGSKNYVHLYEEELNEKYFQKDKKYKYTGQLIDDKLLKKLDNEKLLNLLAVYDNVSDKQQHGVFWIDKDTSKPILYQLKNYTSFNELNEAQQKLAISKTGYYVNASMAMPINRPITDYRNDICIAASAKIDTYKLPTASIIITFINEYVHILLRTLTSILNYTPSYLLREIILVNDDSTLDYIKSGEINEYIKYFPKVRLINLNPRRGLVNARLEGIMQSKADYFIILDSHIEVNPGWIEPMLNILRNDPMALVFPQILTINNKDFSISDDRGIGCRVTMRWSIVEQSYYLITPVSGKPIKSPAFSGGLFGMKKSTFYELGAYDTDFKSWGAEQIEMSLRLWLCGGKILCSPCSYTYHLFRESGSSYENPTGHYWINKMRTASVWLDEYANFSKALINYSSVPSADYGSVESRLALKKELKCKPIKWYLKNVDKYHELQNIESLAVLGRLSSTKDFQNCLHVKHKPDENQTLGVVNCDQVKDDSSAYFYISLDDNKIRLASAEKKCLKIVPTELMPLIKITPCTRNEANLWTITKEGENVYNLIYDKKYCVNTSLSNGILECSKPVTIYGEKRFEIDN